MSTSDWIHNWPSLTSGSYYDSWFLGFIRFFSLFPIFWSIFDFKLVKIINYIQIFYDFQELRKFLVYFSNNSFRSWPKLSFFAISGAWELSFVMKMVEIKICINFSQTNIFQNMENFHIGKKIIFTIPTPRWGLDQSSA